jgi:hypothetical protein
MFDLQSRLLTARSGRGSALAEMATITSSEAGAAT